MEQQGILHGLRILAGWVPQKVDGLVTNVISTTINNVIVHMYMAPYGQVIIASNVFSLRRMLFKMSYESTCNRTNNFK